MTVATNLAVNASNMVANSAGTNVATATGIENLVGGSGSDTLDLSGWSTTRNVVLSGSGTIDGFAGTVNGLAGTFDNVNVLIGSSASDDTLTALNAINTWQVTGSTNSYTSSSRTLSFTSIEVLQGGSASDTFQIAGAAAGTLNGNGGDDAFVFGEGATLAGAVHGGAGSDTIGFAGSTSGVTVTLTAITTGDGFAGTTAGTTFDGINALSGGSGTDTLAGKNVDSAWLLNGATGNTYTASGNTLTFAGFERLAGGTAVDTYTLASGATFAGTADGGAGSDTLTFAGWTTARHVTLTGIGATDGFNGSETNLGGFANIDTLLGGGGAGDLLTGAAVDATWQIGATFLYQFATHSLTVSGWETLAGGSGMDTFQITGTPAVNLAGGSGDDTFVFVPSVALNGTIDGGAGTDTLDYGAYTTPVTVSMATGSATDVRGGATGSVSNVENFTGGTGANYVVGNDEDNVLIGGSSDDIMIGGAGGTTRTSFTTGSGTIR